MRSNEDPAMLLDLACDAMLELEMLAAKKGGEKLSNSTKRTL
jgi:hypothetical protein